jgi:hypothetical protein
VRSADYLVILQVLSPEGRTRASLHAILDSLDTAVIDDAVRRLESAGVLVIDGTAVKPSDALMRLNDLDLIAV